MLIMQGFFCRPMNIMVGMVTEIVRMFQNHVVWEPIKVRKTAKIRKPYNQLLHLTQDTTLESNKNKINITNKSQKVSPFPAGNHKAAMI